MQISRPILLLLAISCALSAQAAVDDDLPDLPAPKPKTPVAKPANKHEPHRIAPETKKREPVVHREPVRSAPRNDIADTPITEREEMFGIRMVSLPAGRFTMGCQSGRDKDCGSDESPSHSVSLSAFELGKTEVTQGQWKAVMGSNPSSFKDCGDTCPVESVSWNDIQTFIQKLNDKTGKHYRLPSEAEWEYACRAGKDTNYCGGNDVNAVAWYGAYATPVGNSEKTTNPVGRKAANAWGLYDMSGNVYEWVQDSYHANYNNAPSDGRAWEDTRADARVLRGGSWSSNPQNVRAANRNDNTPTDRYGYFGFRLARTLP